MAGLGFLGAIGGLGKGISNAGETWATSLREQRLQELKDSSAIASEGRAEKRAIEAEGRKEKRDIEAEGRKEKRDIAAEDRRGTREMAQIEARGTQERKTLQTRKDFGLGMASQEGPGARDRNITNARKQYLNEKKAYEESDAFRYPAEGSSPEPFPDFESWAEDNEYSFAGTTGGASTDVAGVNDAPKTTAKGLPAVAPTKTPFTEGQEVVGPDKKIYIVTRNPTTGRLEPVLKEEGGDAGGPWYKRTLPGTTR